MRTLLLLALFPGPLQAAVEWHAASVVDPAVEEERPALLAVSDDGFRLSLLREVETPRVVSVLRMPPGTMDLLDGERPPLLIIDGGRPFQATLLEGELKWLRFLVWHGEGEPVIGLLRDLMEGSLLEIRYHLYGGGYKETRLPLAGLREAVSTAFGVRAQVSEEEKRRARLLEAARDVALDRCLALSKKKQQERCLTALGGCSGAEVKSEDDLAACLAAAEGE